MKIHHRFTIAGLLVICLSISGSSLAQEEKKPPKLFSINTEMQVTLTGPWNRIQRNVRDDDKYPATLRYTGADGQQHSLDVEVAPRGISRRLRVCKFPPLKVHFDKKALKGTEFRGNKSLKLVTYCHTNSKYEQYYIKEFLAYRIYNLITEYSFRVRPLMIEYKDSERSSGSITRFGFLIEDTDDVAKRHDLEKLDIERVPYNHFDPQEASYFSMFQYLIGNLDWAATDGPDEDSCCHNSKVIGKGNDEKPKFSIPYDFDSSGLVDAHYAAPPDGLKVRNVRQRLFRGFCIHNETLPQAAELFREKKPEILALFENNPHLSDRVRNNATGYVEDFYKVIDNPKRFERDLIGKCRGKKK